MPDRKLGDLPSAMWRIKGTLLIQGVIIAIGIMTKDASPAEHKRLMGQLGFDFDLLAKGHVWHLLTGSWIQVTPGIELSMLALVLGGTVFLEWLAGTGAMLATCITGDWVATILTALTTRVLAGFGSASAAALLALPDAGSSAMAHAGYGAAVMLLPRRWLKPALVILVFLTAIQFFIIDVAPAIAHAWATLYGVVVGWFVLRPRVARESATQVDDRASMSSITVS
jgi:hypothetical protein